jgi:Mn-dependent DtxR family transcriptional regulator
MGRHSAIVEVQLNARVPRGQQAYWDIIRELREFTLSDIDRRCNVARDTIGDYLRRLVKAGFIKADGMSGDAITYKLVKDQLEAPRVKRDGSVARKIGLGTDCMWRSMKMLDTFDAEELAAAASTELHTVKPGTAKDYITRLHQAGYLVIITEAMPGHKPNTGQLARYKLPMHMRTGPRAPQVMRTKFVFDPNTQKIMGKTVDAERDSK